MGKAPLSLTKASSREVLSNTYKEKKNFKIIFNGTMDDTFHLE
jgi:hypothetical protein